MADAAVEFEALAHALKEAGQGGLRREMYKAISDAAGPLADQIRDVEHLKPYMPDPYAEVLAADLSIRVSKRTGTAVGVFLTAKGLRRWHHVRRLNEGILTHPVFGTQAQEAAALARGRGRGGGHGRGWTWVTQRIRPAWFDDPVREAGPGVRREIEAGLRRVRDKIYAA